MKILIDIGHPGHVHLFKNLLSELEIREHKVLCITQDISIVKHLFNQYNIDFDVIGKKKTGKLTKGISMLQRTFNIVRYIKKNSIDFCISSTPSLMQAAFLSYKPSIFMDDDDDDIEPWVVTMAHPFAKSIFSPKNTLRKNRKSIFYEGYHELAYLHPSRFQPDESIINQYGISADEKFFVLRFVALKGHHDVGQKGISLEQKRTLISLLLKKGKVFITSESPIEPEFEQYRIPVSPEKIHHFLYFATMFLGDSQTMTSEAAVLGTPAIRCNSFVGKISYLEDEEHMYGLTYGFKPENFDKLLLKVEELLAMPDLKQVWEEKRLKMLNDKIDVTAFMVWFIGNYPESVKIMKENPSYQYKFR